MTVTRFPAADPRPSPGSDLRLCRVVTLGCKVNQYESQYVREVLEANGYRQAGQREPADLCVVNTCTVTAEADAQGRQLIRRLARDNPGAAVVVMGCYATRAPHTIARLAGVTHVITDKTRLIEELRPFGVTTIPPGVRHFDGHQRAFVKVQDGCLLNCTYCVIPLVRPHLHSRDPEEITAEVATLVATGCREIVLTGVHLGHYGIDRSRGLPRERWCRLWHLLERLGSLPGEFRLRLSSLEAAEVRSDLVRALTAQPRIVPHLHLSLQSGSDRILVLMKRRYRVAGFLERCRRLRHALDAPAFTTDIIVGFPGETEADFEATCAVVRAAGFSRVHVFPFSSRPGTAAAHYPDPVPAAVISRRRACLEELAQELADSYYRSLLGKRLEVLVEGPAPGRPGFVQGTACRYAPVVFEGHAPALLARLVPVIAERVGGGLIFARPLPETAAIQASVGSHVPARERIPLPQVGGGGSSAELHGVLAGCRP